MEKTINYHDNSRESVQLNIFHFEIATGSIRQSTTRSKSIPRQSNILFTFNNYMNPIYYLCFWHELIYAVFQPLENAKCQSVGCEWSLRPNGELASGCKSDWMGVRPYPATDRGIQIATWNFNKLISICKLQTFQISTHSYSYFTSTTMAAMTAAAVAYFLFPLHTKCVSIKNGMKLKQREKNYSKRNSITVSQHMFVNNLNIFYSLPPLTPSFN